MNKLKNLFDIVHQHSNLNSIETIDAFLAGLALGNILQSGAEHKLTEILANISAS